MLKIEHVQQFYISKILFSPTTFDVETELVVFVLEYKLGTSMIFSEALIFLDFSATLLFVYVLKMYICIIPFL